jgi:chorismate mutase / prephenate dehydratase
MSDQRLAELRARIDALDDELRSVLNQRAALTIAVGELKRAGGADTEFYRPEREASILRRMIEHNPGPLPNDDLVRLMREIISTCLSLEKSLKVAYLGPEGTFTQAAALKHFGGAVELSSNASIEEVFRAVESRSCDYGVVPIENSVGGSVSQTLDCLSESSVKICGEVVLPIHHQCLSMAAQLAEIRRIYAHEQALAQCRGWLDRALPGVERIALASNAQAAERVRNEVDAAAIASIDAARRYGLATLAANIEDYPHNTTRFVVLGRVVPKASGDDLTSIVFGMANQPGALHGILGVLAERGISMSRIESRPTRNSLWEYRFYVDIRGHADEATVATALTAIEARAAFYKLLGSYPRAVL